MCAIYFQTTETNSNDVFYRMYYIYCHY